MRGGWRRGRNPFLMVNVTIIKVKIKPFRGISLLVSWRRRGVVLLPQELRGQIIIDLMSKHISVVADGGAPEASKSRRKKVK